MDVYVDKMLEKIIEEELSNMERDGEKIKLKSVRSEKLKTALIWGFFTLVGFIVFFPVGIICLIYLISKIPKINRVSVLVEKAKEMPDTQISDIIKMEMTK